jgi:hypothetical protein
MQAESKTLIDRKIETVHDRGAGIDLYDLHCLEKERHG